MKFIDEVVITVKAGDGGKGCVSFRHELYAPRGGPDGGNGGRGGDVVLTADGSLGTLLDFKYQPLFKAKRGEHGGGSDCNGAGAPDLVLGVPCGTSVFDADTGDLIADLVTPGRRFIAARGGKGGRGNLAFKSATNRAPRQSEPGLPGDEKKLRLELKLIADVGLVGLPNAGKSTLISRLSAARPKIADYPFTTLAPQLGVVRAGSKSFVVADMPGLIEGASLGHGLGIQFLRHIERTRLLLHLVDGQRPDPLADMAAINHELEAFRPELGEKPQLVVITKADLAADPRALAPLKKRLQAKGSQVVVISAVSGYGLPALLKATAKKLDEISGTKTAEEGWEP